MSPCRNHRHGEKKLDVWSENVGEEEVGEGGFAGGGRIGDAEQEDEGGLFDVGRLASYGRFCDGCHSRHGFWV